MLDRILSGPGAASSMDQYFFQMRLISLTNSKPETFGFRIAVQKGVQKIDSTKEAYNIEGLQCSLNDQSLSFYLPSHNPARPIDFTVYMTDPDLNAYTSFKLATSPYIAEFKESGKNTFMCTEVFQDENYQLSFTLFVEKSRAALLGLTKRTSQNPSPITTPYKNVPKEEPVTQPVTSDRKDPTPTRSQITRSPAVARSTLSRGKNVEETPKEPEPQPEVQEPVSARKSGRTPIARKPEVEIPQQPERLSRKQAEVKSPGVKTSTRQSKPVEPEPEPEPPKEEPKQEIQPKPVPTSIKKTTSVVKEVEKIEPPKQEPPALKIEKKVERIEKVEKIEKIQKAQKAEKPSQKPAKPEKVQKVQKPAKVQRVEKPETKTSKPEEKKELKKAQPEEASGGKLKFVVISIVLLALIGGFMFMRTKFTKSKSSKQETKKTKKANKKK